MSRASEPVRVLEARTARLLLSLSLTRGDLITMVMDDASRESAAVEAVARLASERYVYRMAWHAALAERDAHARTVARLREQIRELMGRPRLHEEGDANPS